MIEIEKQIKTWRQAMDWCRRDLYQRGALPEHSSKITFVTLIRDPINLFMWLLRVNELSRNSAMVFPLRLLVRFLYRRQSMKLSFSIPPNVFERGLALVHYGPIIVNSNAKVGENCRVHVGVNIGGSAGLVSAEEALTLSPTIGKNVYIGPGAKLFGPITIGDNNVVGANAVVNKSFEQQNVSIAGIPARKISDQGSEKMIISAENSQ